MQILTLTKKEVVERINQFCIEDLENIKQCFLNGDFDYLADENGFDSFTINDRIWIEDSYPLIDNSIDLIMKFQDEYDTYIELTELYPEYAIFPEIINELLDEIKDNDEVCGILQYPDSEFIHNNKFIRIVTYAPVFIGFRFEKGEKEWKKWFYQNNLIIRF